MAPDEDKVTALERRRQAAQRLPALECGCTDPWICRHRAALSDPRFKTSFRYPSNRKPMPKPSGAELDMMARAVKALLDRGESPGLWKIEDVRALWMRNRPGDRELAQRIKDAGCAIEDFPGSAAA